jgi:hypothetical protein
MRSRWRASFDNSFDEFGYTQSAAAAGRRSITMSKSIDVMRRQLLLDCPAKFA